MFLIELAGGEDGRSGGEPGRWGELVSVCQQDRVREHVRIGRSAGNAAKRLTDRSTLDETGGGARSGFGWCLGVLGC